ncbi:MAG: sodium:solute symporter [Spirosomataceae bacterium]
MPPLVLFLIIVGYFSLLMLMARLTSRHRSDTTFFDGDRKSPWFLVAFGMIGSGISAVSLVSIPGNVGNENLYYFQFILGTLAGYLFIAFVLLPVFYKQQLVSIYGYLQRRFGSVTYKTGATFFVVSQSFGAALRLLLSVKILQSAFFDAFQLPYFLTIVVVLVLIWLYTHQSGVKTIVWTDALQSFFLIVVIVISIWTICTSLGYPLSQLGQLITQQPTFRFFDWQLSSGTYFFKQFIAGFLITVALVGLDQSMMQKTLTVKNAHDAQKNVLTFSFFIAFAQTLFLLLGVLIYLFAKEKGIALPQENGKYTAPDELYPLLTLHYFGRVGTVAFLIGVVASTFASIDSCITALTTSISYDFFAVDTKTTAQKIRIKNGVLLGVNALMFVIVMFFWNSQGAIINAIFKIAGYTYGPLLGLYLMGFFTKLTPQENRVPWACILAAVGTYALNTMLEQQGFDLGFLNIFVNALLTCLLLWFIRNKHD